MTRWPKTLLTVAGTLLAVCVLVTLAAPREVHDRRDGDQRPGQLVYDTPVLADLTTRVRAPIGWRVLDTPADHVAYSGWLVRSEPVLADRLRSLSSDDTHVHVVGHESVGCGGVSGPQVRRAGPRYVLDFASRPTQQVECYAPVEAVVVFRVPRSDARAFGSQPAGPGVLAAHFPLTGTRPSTVRPMEITDREDQDRLLAALAADGDRHDRTRLAADIAAAVAAQGRDEARVFAVPVGTCAGAIPTLDITAPALRVQVSPVCTAPLPSLVAFVVPARIVPDGAAIG
jgi:hypothetical protein